MDGENPQLLTSLDDIARQLGLKDLTIMELMKKVGELEAEITRLRDFVPGKGLGEDVPKRE